MRAIPPSNGGVAGQNLFAEISKSPAGWSASSSSVRGLASLETARRQGRSARRRRIAHAIAHVGSQERLGMAMLTRPRGVFDVRYHHGAVVAAAAGLGAEQMRPARPATQAPVRWPRSPPATGRPQRSEAWPGMSDTWRGQAGTDTRRQAIADVMAQGGSSKAARRAWRTSSVSLSTSMPSAAAVAQAGTSRPCPTILTMHARQDAAASQPSRKQSVGISMPRRRAASKTVAPGGTFHLAMVDRKPRHGQAPQPVPGEIGDSIATAPAGQTWRQASQRVHFCKSIACRG